jgi:cytochrome c oxidase subunit IV
MRVEYKMFRFLTAFFVLSAVVYAAATAKWANGGVEWAGVTGLVMTSGLTLIIWTFFQFVARRLDTRPEDYPDAEISDGAGELGFYSPHSWWPLFIALSASVTAVGVALWLPWLIAAGAAFILATAAGLVFEYYTGPEKH